jgi:hypothetical protein
LKRVPGQGPFIIITPKPPAEVADDKKPSYVEEDAEELSTPKTAVPDVNEFELLYPF